MMSTNTPPEASGSSPLASTTVPTKIVYELATTAAKIGVWHWDLLTNKLEWDDNLCSLHQVPGATRKSGLFFDHWRARVHPDDLVAAEKHVANAVLGLHPLGQDYRVLLPDGSVRWLRSAGVIEYDANRKPVRAVGIDRDITEEKQLEATLREKADRLDLIVNALDLGIWTWDFATGELVWDRRLCDIYQVPQALRQSGLYYDFWRSRVYPDDIKRVENELDAVRHDGTRFESSFRILRDDGSLRLIRSVATCERAANGTPVRMVGLNQDITEAARKEALLQENVISLKLAAEAAGFGVWSWDLKTDEAFWDERMCAIFETPEYVRNSGGYFQFWRTRLHPDDRERVAANFANARKNSAPYDVTYRIVLRDGSVRYVRALSVVQRDASNDPLRMVGINRDITEEVQQATKLRESKEILSKITDSATDGIMMMDADGIVTFCNPAAEKILGYSASELLGKNLHMLLAPERYHADFRQAHAEFRRTGRGSVIGKTLELLAKRKGGSELAISLSLGAFNLKGAWHAVGIIQDISERKRLEAEKLVLEKNLADLAREESLGLLAGGIAHDFNNIHGGILNAVELISRGLGPNAPQQTLLESIRKATQRASGLSHQMLSYSGKASITLRRHAINDLVNEAIRLTRHSLPGAIEIALNLGENLPAINGDEMQLKEVVANLVTNAVDAIGRRNGRITVTTRLSKTTLPTPEGPLHARNLPPGCYVCLEVADNGPGIPPEIQAKVFDPFVTTKAAGRGLGLSFALGVVRGHKGAIFVQSELGRGTCFTVLLPCAAASATPVAQPPATPAPMAKGEVCILLADDDELLRSTTADILEIEGFKVVTACDGREAVDLFQVNPTRFDLVLLDLIMPRLNGDDALALMRKIKPEMRALVVSGYPPEEISSRFAEGKPTEYLVKPFTLTALLAAIRVALAASK